ncbi:MAG: hypothetical protein K2P81_08200 [Bacteriovoracaceae bacterium]|nr:hypothetical protein [Bacteriovoracaceae bacterium]
MSKTIVEDKTVEAAPEVMTLKNFRTNNEDIETFYRFVHDNDVRREAGMLIQYAMDKLRKARKNKRAAKTLQ